MPPHSNQLLISRDVTFTRWLFHAYLLLLFLLPLPLGSNRPIFWSLMVAAIALITLVWAFGLLTGVARWPGAVNRARWVLIPLGLFVLLSVQAPDYFPILLESEFGQKLVIGAFVWSMVGIYFIRRILRIDA